ncbi:MAG: hypothetical protein Q9227_003358 [Pyrenula ochraceoflavens]
MPALGILQAEPFHGESRALIIPVSIYRDSNRPNEVPNSNTDAPYCATLSLLWKPAIWLKQFQCTDEPGETIQLLYTTTDSTAGSTSSSAHAGVSPTSPTITSTTQISGPTSSSGAGSGSSASGLSGGAIGGIVTGSVAALATVIGLLQAHRHHKKKDRRQRQQFELRDYHPAGGQRREGDAGRDQFRGHTYHGNVYTSYHNYQ